MCGLVDLSIFLAILCYNTQEFIYVFEAYTYDLGLPCTFDIQSFLLKEQIMSMVLPSTVEEINCMQNSFQYRHLLQIKENKEEFANINAGRFKREVSLPNGVQWNVQDFDAYLNFDEPNLVNVEVIQSHDDSVVPGEEQRPRSESISSVTSSMDDKSYVYNNLPVKTFNTVCVDSGSTCISSDHSYVNVNFAPSVFNNLEAEETFQNLHPFLTQGAEIHNTDTSTSISSNSHINDSQEYSVLSNFSMLSSNSQDSFSDRSVGCKRSAAVLDEDHFMTDGSSKRTCESPDGRFSEMRRKNNASSKNCRKTRKEKQKEMENRVKDLERENQDLTKQIEYLLIMTREFKRRISSIMRPLQNA